MSRSRSEPSQTGSLFQILSCLSGQALEGLTFWERPIVVKRNHYSVKNLLDQIEGCGDRAPCTSSSALQQSTSCCSTSTGEMPRADAYQA